MSETKEPKAGYVYIMTNPSYKDNIVKVGQTTNPEKRRKQLSQGKTAVPTEFQIYALMKTVRYKEVESSLHNILEKVVHNRISKDREFFQILPEEAYYLLKELKPFIEDAEITFGDGSSDEFLEDPSSTKKYEKAENMTLKSYSHYDDCKQLFADLKQAAIEVAPDATLVYKKLYVAFKKKSNFMDVVFQKNCCLLYFNMPFAVVKNTSHEAIVEDCSRKGHWGNGEVAFRFTEVSQLETVKELAKLAINNKKKK